MRKLSIVAGWLLLALLPGCTGTGFNLFKPGTAKGPPQPVPTKEALCRYLNENSISVGGFRKVQSLDCNDIDIRITQGLRPVNLKANLVLQAPRNFFMRGNLAGSTCFELGSNDQEFWWWMKDPGGRPSAQYFCSYRDLEQNRAGKLNFPLQPEWIIEVLGLGPYGPPEKYQLVSDAETVRLIEKTVVQGQAITKAIVFQRRPKSLPEPIVSDYILTDDATGKEICSAHIAEAYLDGTITNAVLPRKIEINCPGMKVRIVMTFNDRDIHVNPGMQVVADGKVKTNPGRPISMSAFERRSMNGIESINLAGALPTGFQRVRGN